MSRRQFLGTATAATALALGSQLWIPELVRAAKPAGALPNPIPGGTQIDGLGFFHFYFPTANNPVGATDTIENGRGDPATITDFDGMIGMSDFTGGTGVGTPGGSFWSADVRFMKGEYVGVDGKHHHGAFAFIWVDVYTSQVLTPPNQIHDFNPGIESNGLFWTAAIPPDSVTVNPGAGKASLHLSDFDIDDYGNVVNALMGGAEVSASISLDITWSGVQQRLNLRNETTHFAGEFVHNSATMSWSASEAGSSFTANPFGSDFAEVGHERNGVFFPT